MTIESRKLRPPTEEELAYVGFEPWQIQMVSQLRTDIQWEVYDEFIIRMMSDAEDNKYVF